jgi:ABC-2 type transport system permease protein
LRFDWFILIVVKEFRQIVRDKRVLMISMVLPALLMGLVGTAFSADIKHISLGVVDEDLTATSISFTHRLETLDTLHVAYTPFDREHAESLIRDGKVRAAVVIPDGFESDLKGGHAMIYLYVDGSDPIVAGIVRPTLEATVLSFSPAIKMSITSDIMFNPQLHYLQFLAPSIVGLIVQFLPTFLMSISLAGEKERGTIEQLVVTPIGGPEILLGKMVTYSVIGSFQAALALGIAIIFFGLRVQGSILIVAAFLLVFTLASVSVGTLSSVFAKNQIQAIQQIIPFVYVSIFLSGVFYPLDSMPELFRPISYFIPMTYVNHALRALITRGAGLEVVLQDLAALCIYATAVMAMAVTLFKKKLE